MKLIRVIAKVAYFLSWGLCILPAAPPREEKPHEQVDERIEKDHQLTEEDIDEGVCEFPLQQDILKDRESNHEDYDSGDH